MKIIEQTNFVESRHTNFYMQTAEYHVEWKDALHFISLAALRFITTTNHVNHQSICFTAKVFLNFLHNFYDQGSFVSISSSI